MFYDKKIKYLDEVLNGERIGSAGFVKAELRGDVCRIRVQVKGLRLPDSFEKEVMAVCEDGLMEYKLCRISILEGRGDTGEVLMNCGEVPYSSIRAIKIPMGAGWELSCEWGKKARESAEAVESEKAGELQGVIESEKVGESAEAGELQSEVESEKAGESAEAGELQSEVKSEKAGESAEAGELQSVVESEKVGELQKTEEMKTVEISENVVAERTVSPRPFPLEDKWKQLWAVYPHISPFGDDREYLSLGPSDFVILPEAHYRLVNNSFLLHGYHNYGHVILCREKIRGEIRYYIGVPGNYYEKEKQVAVMFGFESFECKTEPADYGTFGYYMIRIVI